ncbi:MAG TPA: hypothetical protein VF533_16200 [Solirubrobacteraceae bacterium]|jgi:hypothetical protein
MRRRCSGWATLAATVLVGAAVGAPGAVAAENPVLAVQPNGTAHIGWMDFDGEANVLKERSRTSLGTLSPAQWVSPAGAGLFGLPDLAVAADGSGNALYVWNRLGDPGAIQIRRRAADGALGAVQTVSSAGGYASRPDVALDGPGNAVIVWSGSSGDTSVPTVIKARRRSAAGVLGPVMSLSPAADEVGEARVAIDSSGGALAVWSRTDGDGEARHGVVELRRIAPNGTLGPVTPVSSPGVRAGAPRVGLDADGDAIIAYVEHDGTRYTPRIRRRTAAGVLSAPQSPVTSGASVAELDLAVVPDGRSMLTWTRPVGSSSSTLQALHRAADGTLGPVLTLSSTAAGAFAVHHDAAVDPQGNGAVVWMSSSGIRLRRRAADGTVSLAQQLSAVGVPSADPRIGFDAAGTALAVWESRRRDDSTDTFIEAVHARRVSPTGQLGVIQTLGQ